MNLLAELHMIGAIQLGQFESVSGQFVPLQIDLRIVPSFPALLGQLADAFVPVVKSPSGAPLHLLAMPAVVPLATAICLQTGQPLVYPGADRPGELHGVYDFDVPAILLTDVLTDGHAESAMVRHARKEGLDVKIITAVFDLGQGEPVPGAQGSSVPCRALVRAADLIQSPGIASPAMAETLARWLSTLTLR